MTSEKAIQLLHRLQDEQFDGIHGDERREALEMAVRAMSGEGDTISRKAAIDVIDAIFPVNPMETEYAQGIACGAALAKTYIKQLPSAQPQWIPCSERLPEANGRYLVTR